MENNENVARIARIVSSVSALQVVKMAYFVFLNKYDLEDSGDDELAFENATKEAFDKIQEVDEITEKAESSVIKLINKVDRSWELKVEQYGSFNMYLRTLGADIKNVSIEDQKKISGQIVGLEMTVREMLEIVG